MFIIVHSRRVGAQKWVKCGPRNSWMTPGLGFTHKLTILQAVKQERPIMNQQFTFISPHYSPGIRKHTRWWPYWWYILPYTEPVEPRGYFPPRPPHDLAPIEAKRSFFSGLLQLPAPQSFYLTLRFARHCLPKRASKDLGVITKWSEDFFKGEGRRRTFESKFSYDLLHTCFK